MFGIGGSRFEIRDSRFEVQGSKFKIQGCSLLSYSRWLSLPKPGFRIADCLGRGIIVYNFTYEDREV